MNRIVKEHYPVSLLPEELQKELRNVQTVRLELQPDQLPTMLEDATQVEQAIRDLLAARTSSLSVTEQDSVARVRRLRDEWDD